MDAVQWRNRLGIIMTANSEWVVPASTDERRFMVFNTNDHFAQNSRTSTPTDRQAYFSDLDHEIGNGGLGAMLYDLQNWNLGGWHPRVIHETDALRDQKRASMSAVEQWFEAVLEDGILPGLRMPGNEHYATTRAFLEDFQRRAPHGARYAVGDKLIGTPSSNGLQAGSNKWNSLVGNAPVASSFDKNGKKSMDSGGGICRRTGNELGRCDCSAWFRDNYHHLSHVGSTRQ